MQFSAHFATHFRVWRGENVNNRKHSGYRVPLLPSVTVHEIFQILLFAWSCLYLRHRKAACCECIVLLCSAHVWVSYVDYHYYHYQYFFTCLIFFAFLLFFSLWGPKSSWLSRCSNRMQQKRLWRITSRRGPKNWSWMQGNIYVNEKPISIDKQNMATCRFKKS